MRILVTWGSTRGGTAGIGQILGEALKTHGFEVDTAAADKVDKLDSFDAVIIGGALYANRWPRSVRRFVNRHVMELRKRPVWLFSSGPLDDSADHTEIPPPGQVAILSERIGAKGHITFGGRLAPDARGFPASAMAKNAAGDYRNPERIRAWATELAALLPSATPGQAITHPARALTRLLAHGMTGWGLCAALMVLLLLLPSLTAALVLHAIAAPIIFTAIAWHYFRARGAREPMTTAASWTAMVASLDLVLAAVVVPDGLAMWKSILGTWLPLPLIFCAVFTTGFLMSTMPWPKRAPQVPHAPLATPN